MSPAGVIAPAVYGSLPPVLTQPVKAATLASITLSGTPTIDGIALNAGDRVLVKSQGGPGYGAETAHAQNGIYVVQSGAWTLAPDWQYNDQITAAGGLCDLIVPVLSGGTVNGGTRWRMCTGSFPIALGITPIAFARADVSGHQPGGIANYWNPGVLFQLANMKRTEATSNAVPAAGAGVILCAGGIVIPGGRSISNAYMWEGSNAASYTSPHLWTCLVRARDNLLLAVSNDITTGSQAANGLLSWNLAYSAPADTAVWVGVCFAGTLGTAPNFHGTPAPTHNVLMTWTPTLVGTTGSGLTTPASAGTPGTTILTAPAAVTQGVPFVLLN